MFRGIHLCWSANFSYKMWRGGGIKEWIKRWDERMDQTILSVFHSVSNCARGEVFFLVSCKRLYDVHIT